MKSILLFGLVISLLTTSCTADDEIILINHDLELLTGVNLKIAADVIIIEGETQEVRIEGKKREIKHIRKKVKNGVWDIEFDKPSFKRFFKITIYITTPSITELKISGSGNIVSKSTFMTEKVTVSGSGSITFITEASSIDSNISGSGRINVSGITDLQKIKISGSGNYNAFSCESNETNISVSGSGNCEVFVKTSLDAKITGSGNIHYIGAPVIMKDITGSGKLVNSN